jgi:hypothetical protein
MRLARRGAVRFGGSRVRARKRAPIGVRTGLWVEALVVRPSARRGHDCAQVHSQVGILLGLVCLRIIQWLKSVPCPLISFDGVVRIHFETVKVVRDERSGYITRPIRVRDVDPVVVLFSHPVSLVGRVASGQVIGLRCRHVVGPPVPPIPATSGASTVYLQHAAFGKEQSMQRSRDGGR